jgi:hypothetical protein
MRTVVYLRNRLCTPVASGGLGGVPYTIFHGVFTNLADVHVFGCTAYLRLEDRFIDKLFRKALRCMFTRYRDDGPGHWVLNLAPPAPTVAYETCQTSPPHGLKPWGAASANLSCVDSPQSKFPTNNPFTILDDVQEGANPTTQTDDTDRESSSCFAAPAYVQRTNRIA